jgi:hypothetical protein
MQAATKKDHLKAAAALAKSSPHVTKGYTTFAVEDGIVLNTAKMPLRGNLTPVSVPGVAFSVLAILMPR